MGKKYMDTREGTLESSILDVWKNAADLQEKGMPPWLDKDKKEGNAFGMALKAAKDKGEKTFVVSGKKYDVKTEEEIPSKGAKKTETGKTAAKVEINPEIDDKH